MPGDDPEPGMQADYSPNLCCNIDTLSVADLQNMKAHLLKCILLQEVLAYVDESARATFFGEFSNECFGLLDEALYRCGAGFS